MRGGWRTILIAFYDQITWKIEEIRLLQKIYHSLRRTTYALCPYSQHNLSILNTIHSEILARTQTHSAINTQYNLASAVELDSDNSDFHSSKLLIYEILTSSNEWEMLDVVH